MKLNLGCGRDMREGWINIDHPSVESLLPTHGTEFVACDLDQPSLVLPFEDNTFSVIDAIHILEHVRNLLPLIQELHRIAKIDAKFQCAVPYGGSDDAWEDPTHVRAFFLNSWIYFGQPTYWRADHGYRGDWKPIEIGLSVVSKHNDSEMIFAEIMGQRNIVKEMRCIFQAVKPIRVPTDGKDIDRCPIHLLKVEGQG